MSHAHAHLRKKREPNIVPGSRETSQITPPQLGDSKQMAKHIAEIDIDTRREVQEKYPGTQSAESLVQILNTRLHLSQFMDDPQDAHRCLRTVPYTKFLFAMPLTRNEVLWPRWISIQVALLFRSNLKCGGQTLCLRLVEVLIYFSLINFSMILISRGI